MLIMLPRPRGAMRRATAWPTRQTPVRLVSRTCAQSCSVISRKRSEEHTSELQSLMRISYAVFCLKKKKHTHISTNIYDYMNKYNIKETKNKVHPRTKNPNPESKTVNTT